MAGIKLVRGWVMVWTNDPHHWSVGLLHAPTVEARKAAEQKAKDDEAEAWQALHTRAAGHGQRAIEAFVSRHGRPPNGEEDVAEVHALANHLLRLEIN